MINNKTIEIIKKICKLLQNTNSKNESGDLFIIGDYDDSNLVVNHYLQSLDKNELLNIITIMYIGRGDIDENLVDDDGVKINTDEFSKIFISYRERLNSTFKEKEYIVKQLLSKKVLYNYLNDGILKIISYM